MCLALEYLMKIQQKEQSVRLRLGGIESKRKKVPDRLWDYGISNICETGNIFPRSSKNSKGRTLIDYFSWENLDISENIDSGFYDSVMLRSNTGLGKAKIGQWLAVSHKMRQLASYWILLTSKINKFF